MRGINASLCIYKWKICIVFIIVLKCSSNSVLEGIPSQNWEDLTPPRFLHKALWTKDWLKHALTIKKIIIIKAMLAKNKQTLAYLQKWNACSGLHGLQGLVGVGLKLRGVRLQVKWSAVKRCFRITHRTDTTPPQLWLVPRWTQQINIPCQIMWLCLKNVFLRHLSGSAVFIWHWARLNTEELLVKVTDHKNSNRLTKGCRLEAACFHLLCDVMFSATQTAVGTVALQSNGSCRGD